MKKDIFLAVKIYIMLWLISLISLQLLPIQSKFENELDSIILIIVFVFTVSTTAVFWYRQAKSIKRKIPRKISRKKLNFIIYWSSFSTIVGNLFIYIDRVFFRGIDYSRGFRNARYQWASAIPGSVISVLGNLMVPFSYCVLFMGIFHWEVLNKKQRVLAILAGFGGQFGLAMLNGGRSNILLSIVFAFVVCILRKYLGKSFLPKFRGRTFWVFVAAAAVLSYVTAILYAFSGNDLRYLQLTADVLGARVSPNYQGNSLVNMLTEIVLYMLHGIYYIAAVINENSGVADINHNISFRSILVILAKRTPLFNSYKMELPSFDGGGGNFIALPGILLYDYGYFGFFVASIVLGIMLGITLKYLNSSKNNYGVIELVIMISVMINLYMSMITIALGFGYFMFMIFAMLCMELIAGTIFGRSGWIKVEE